MDEKFLIATDLDRTLLPNGAQEESIGARQKFKDLVSRDEILLSYVSGRSEKLLKDAIEEYDLPMPDFAIGDVGTTIFTTHDGSWRSLDEWRQLIVLDWKGKTHSDLKELFSGVDELILQEDNKQNTFKLSYYAHKETDSDKLIEKMSGILKPNRINASLIWSIDESNDIGLMDVLPASATKLHAIRFLLGYLEINEERTVFCGDSGNDMPVLTSGLNSVLVANASDRIKKEASDELRKKGMANRLYIAKGEFPGMNGNYSAGVLEGVAHFFGKKLQPPFPF